MKEEEGQARVSSLHEAEANQHSEGNRHNLRGRRTLAVLTAALALTGCLALVACGGSSSSSKSSSSSGDSSAATASTAQSASTATKQAAKYVVTIDGATTGQDYQGNPAIIVTYTFTNNGEKSTSPAAAIMNKAYQNSVELSDAIMTSGIDNDGYLKEIKTGGTVSYQQAYTLDDQSTVTVESTELISFSDEKLATATFEVA